MMQKHDTPMRESFRYFRQVWSPRAAYYLAAFRYHYDYKHRFFAALWLCGQKIPLSGSVQSLDFRGMPERHFRDFKQRRTL